MARYSATMMNHFNTPRNAGSINNPDAVGKGSLDGRAPYITLYLRIHEDIVTQATFTTFGCGASIASGSALTELMSGRNLTACKQLSDRDVIEALDGLPPQKEFCAGLAIRAMQAALNNYQKTAATCNQPAQ